VIKTLEFKGEDLS